MNDKPNILLFFTDDQRFDVTHALGTEQIHTPNLDALVARGTTFTRAHIPGGTCGAVCMPSRAMLHTGRTLFHIEGNGRSIPQEHSTLGECLRSAGYTTFGTGKWHNGKDEYNRSFSTGDEIFFGGMGDHWNVPAHRFDPSGKYDSQYPVAPREDAPDTPNFKNCDHIDAGTHSTDLFINAAIRFLEQHKAPNPFFMYVSLMAPHDPRIMPQEFLDMYDPEDIPLPENFLPEHPIDTGSLRNRDEMLAAFPRDPKEIKRHIAEYYAMISHLDHAFGRLITKLKEQGTLDNTIIIFAGDNGLAVGQHGLMGKQSLYDHSVRVPLVFAGPGLPEGEKRDALVYLLDIFPTLCDLTNTETPDSVEGQSLTTCLKDSSATIRTSLYLAYAETIRGVTDGRHKLVEYACGTTQFFDLLNDPLEMNSLADKDSSSATVAEMRQQLVKMANEWNDEEHPTGQEFWSKRPDLKS